MLSRHVGFLTSFVIEPQSALRARYSNAKGTTASIADLLIANREWFAEQVLYDVTGVCRQYFRCWMLH